MTFLLITLGPCMWYQEAVLVTVEKGNSVLFNCSQKFANATKIEFYWYKEEASPMSICEFVLENKSGNMRNCKTRLLVTESPWPMLLLQDVRVSDSGRYKCKTERFIPPPNVGDTSETNLSVVGPPDITLQYTFFNHSSDCVQLLCILEDFFPYEVNVTWWKDGRRVDEGDHLQGLFSDQTVIIASFNICKPSWKSGDVVSCLVNHSASASVMGKNVTLYPNKDTLYTNYWNNVSRICASAAFIIMLLCYCAFRYVKVHDLYYTSDNDGNVNWLSDASKYIEADAYRTIHLNHHDMPVDFGLLKLHRGASRFMAKCQNDCHRVEGQQEKALAS
ncbi:uncharacterized protein LOC120524402 [Polypterus senegalus]|uniref:uncharacterized protein LOC120524402 n=1 Tax=Polypterus senegalus TaxID=55291 RepID=UPI0019631529|nr:uncharacterized protein LOC120524402 [Polypterus senegalus]